MSVFHDYYYFLALYLPKILAVVMATFWSIIFSGLKLMEPLCQLCTNTGAYASDSMFGNYLASGANFLSLSATFRGQWVLLLGGTVLIGWAGVVALMSEAMDIISLEDCHTPELPSFRCAPGWVVNRPVLYALLALIGLIFALILILIIILSQRKPLDIFTDPSSIAAMAELLGNPLVMEDLQMIKPSSSNREVKMLLGENRYKIGFYDSVSGREISPVSSKHNLSRWGLIKVDLAPSPQELARRRQAGYGAVSNPGIVSIEEERANHRRRVSQAIFDSVMLLTALCVFGLVLGYYLDGESDPLNDFFNSATFGPRLVLTVLGLILSLGWRHTFQKTAAMAPYRRMARAYQKQSSVAARRSILTPIARVAWTAFYKALVARHYMVAAVAICVMLADLLLVAVSGVPFSSGQTVLSFRISSFVSLSVLGVMIPVSIAMIFYNRVSAGGTRKLPRSPDTMVGVWLYLCHSSLVTKKEDHSNDQLPQLNTERLERKYDGYHCGFAPVFGADGVRRWTVDDVAELPSARYRVEQHHHHHHQAEQNLPHHSVALVQRPQPYEASATPIESPYQHYVPRDAALRRKPLPRSQPLCQTEVQLYEAQAKSPTVEAPASRFEALRPQTHAQNQPKSQPASAQEPGQPELTPYEVLAQWEYEQECNHTRRISASSMYSEAGRWTNDGRSWHRYS